MRLLAALDPQRQSMIIMNSGSSTVYLGGSDVTPSTGLALQRQQTFNARTFSGSIYVIGDDEMLVDFLSFPDPFRIIGESRSSLKWRFQKRRTITEFQEFHQNVIKLKITSLDRFIKQVFGPDAQYTITHHDVPLDLNLSQTVEAEDVLVFIDRQGAVGRVYVETDFVLGTVLVENKTFTEDDRYETAQRTRFLSSLGRFGGEIVTMDTPSVNVSTTSVILIAENVDRTMLSIQNSGLENVFISDNSPATINDFLIPPQSTLSNITYEGAIYAITDDGSSLVYVLEESV